LTTARWRSACTLADTCGGKEGARRGLAFARVRDCAWGAETRRSDRGHATGSARVGSRAEIPEASVGGTWFCDALHRMSLRALRALPSPGASESAPPARRARRASRSLRAARSHRAPRAARRPCGGAPPPPSRLRAPRQWRFFSARVSAVPLLEPKSTES
jgi:hypothetical protein